MQRTEWLTTTKPTFQIEWLALPPKEAHQILEKIAFLTKDPHPDGHLKKQLVHKNRDVYRLESGHYRILYTFKYPYISLLKLKRRREDTYDEDFSAEDLDGYNPSDALEQGSAPTIQSSANTPSDDRPFPEAITKELLINLFVPASYHARLLPLKTEEELYRCPGVPDEYVLKIMTHMFDKPIEQVLEEKDYALPVVNDLMRFKKGELLGFLLKLSPEQEKYANWGLNAAGPTLLKGGPGTGKSTIALYRVRSLIGHFRRQGREDFKVLFTTYTHALVRSSEQLLEQLLDEDSDYVEVVTADKVVRDVLNHAGRKQTVIEQGELEEMLVQAIDETTFTGTGAQLQEQRQTIASMSYSYLLQEINTIIIGGQLLTLEAYQQASRQGRRLSLNRAQRQAIWSVYLILQKLLRAAGKATWQQLRAEAEEIAAQQPQRRYDAVIIDEAQDLDPGTLRLLVHLCVSPDRLFITADANQSIYGSHFSWSTIHQDLQFRGRTAVVQANYRSTHEIGEAAQSYLTDSLLDDEQIERLYTFHGPLPVMRTVYNEQEEAQLLASFLHAAIRECKLGYDSCVILVPTEKAGKALAADLHRHTIEATFMSGQALTLKRPGVKILTLNSAKGLEFPIVAIAGLQKTPKYMYKGEYKSLAEQREALALERRLLFVGMTRAMRALLVVVPAKSQAPVLTGLEEPYWNCK